MAQTKLSREDYLRLAEENIVNVRRLILSDEAEGWKHVDTKDDVRMF